MITLIINIIILSIVIGIVYFFILYTSLIKKRNTVKEAFSTIDVHLKKRYSLIPNLLTIANKFMEHEKELFSKIAQLRNQALKIPNDVKYVSQKIEIDKQIKFLMNQLQITVENYPQLKSDKIILDTMHAFNYTEEYIAAARRYYNASVKEFNNSVEIFPSSIIAQMLGYQKADFIKADENERKELDNSNKYFNK